MKISSVEQMRAMDRKAIEDLGISEEILMENAGRAAFSVLCRSFGEVPGRRYALFCGVGNNGGDGLVVARHILAGGGTPLILLVGDPARFRGAARTNWEIVRRLPIEILPVTDLKTVRPAVVHSAAIIDALFGTGLDREAAGLCREAIDLINASGRPVLSLDIPSGVNGDTGAVMGAAVRADQTVTFGLPKTGNLLHPGFALGGRLQVCHISFPPALYADPAIGVETNDAPPLPPRPPTAHKGTMGEVLFIAGAAGYIGAPLFSALSFLKAGGGYSRLAAPRSLVPFLAVRGSEIVFHPQEETPEGSIALANREALLTLAERAAMIVVGPGLSLTAETQQLVRELAAAIDRPLLIDGDGLTALARTPEILRNRRAPTVLTPHAGELARLSGRSTGEIETDRIGSLRVTAADLRSLVVLKGAQSLIGTPEGRVFVNLSGNPGMATAGAGDVLTGTIAAMFTLGLPLAEAVCKGVFIHGLAGDLAAAQLGQDGLTAGDILVTLPAAMKQDREGVAATAGHYILPAIV